MARRGLDDRQQRRRSNQRGAIAVELALVTPLFLLLILGCVHVGKAATIRHRLTTATNYAARAAAIAGTADQEQIRQLIEQQVDTASCSNVAVETNTIVNPVNDTLGLTSLEVLASCDVDTGIGQSFLGAIGPDQVHAKATVAFDVEPIE